MQNYFLKLPSERRKEILEGSEAALGIKPYLLEKDIWICWVLNKLFNLPKKMAFKGGTSLSKCYNLIDRFSEDVDVTIDYRDFMPDLDIAKETTSSLKRKRKKLKEMLADYIVDYVIPMLEREFAKEFDLDDFNIEFEEGEKLYLKYPSSLDASSNNYVADRVLIEFGATNKTEPNEEKRVTSYLSQVTKELVLPDANVIAFSPERTFWEKVTLIHVECYRGRLISTPDRLSRHWHDLAILSKSPVGSLALKNKALLSDVLLIKKAFFDASYANYDKCEQGEFRLVPNDNEIDQLKLDYKKMIESDMFLNAPLSFEEILKEIKAIENSINKNG